MAMVGAAYQMIAGAGLDPLALARPGAALLGGAMAAKAGIELTRPRKTWTDWDAGTYIIGIPGTGKTRHAMGLFRGFTRTPAARG